MNIYQYTAYNNPSGAIQVVESHGMRADKHDLPKQLALVISKSGEEGRNILSSIHPDLQLFQNNLDKFKNKIKTDFEVKEKELFWNAVGTKGSSPVTETKEIKVEKEGKSTQELLVIGGLIVLSLAIVFKK